MAIIIPSRKIYGMENSKIPKNVISAIDVVQNDVSLIEDKEHSQKLTYELDLTKGTSGTQVTSSFKNIDASPQIPTPNLFGTWVFKAKVDLPTVTNPININVPFKSYGKTFDGITANSNGISYYSYDELIVVFESGSWKNINYQKVAFERAKETIQSYYDWFTENAELKFMIMQGGEVRSTDKTYSFDINRDREGYYITEINPRVEVKFDVEISKIKADASWGKDTYGITFPNNPDTNKIVQSSTISNNYTFDRTYRVNNYKKSLLYETNISILPSYINIDFSSKFEQKNDDLSSQEEYSIISSFSWNSDSWNGEDSQTNINPYYPYEISLIESEDKYDVYVSLVDSLTVMVAQSSIDSGYNNYGTPADALMIKMIAREAKVVFDETVRYLVIKNVNNRYGASNTEEIFSIGRNSLIRPQTAYDSENATEKFANSILKLYGSGRETATILCSIGDYYDEDNKVQITTKPSQPSHPMLFNIGDSVIPMVLDKDGNDVPMSIIDVSIGNDIAKAFRVVGVRVFYDGAVWQELTLRE